MGDGDAFPDSFYSRAPLPERVDLINLKDGKHEQFYWMLSIESDSRNKPQNRSNYATLAPYDDNEAELVDCCDLEDNYEINPTKSGKYITSFYVPSALHSVIIGARGLRLKQLQDNTQTLIKVPKPDETGKVKITGHSERSVASARTQIALLLLTQRERMSVTHFVSVPVCSGEIRTNFQAFKDGILKGPSTRGIDETIFQKVDKFHLTIVTLTLLDEQEIEEAKSILSNCRDDIKSLFLNRKPIITLKGVEIMNDDPSEVDVLYGKVSLGTSEETAKFQDLANEILNSFYKNGLVRKQYDAVKLHVTLMNSLFRKNDEYQLRDRAGTKRESFDATYILEKYKDFYFGKTSFSQIELSVRFTTSRSGYYEAAASISL